MCCIDKKNYTCCCGCTLTTGTWILGVLIMIEMVFSFLTQQWLAAVSQLILAVPFALTMWDRHSVFYRKFLFYFYLAGVALWVIAMLIALIVWSIFSVEFEDEVFARCSSDPTLQAWFGYSPNSCAEAFRKAIMWTVCVSLVVGLFFNWLFARMLYYGW